MLDLIHYVLKEDSDITSLTGSGDATRIFPYFRTPDEATTYPAIFFEQDGSDTQHVMTQNTPTEGVAYDSFVVVISSGAPTIAEAWKLFHFVRTRMTSVAGFTHKLGANKWTLIDAVFDEVQVDLILGGDLGVAEARFDVHTQYVYEP